jgi:hypothetical protein
VFSKDKQDLGKARNFKHKIDLKEDNSIYIKQFPMPEVHRYTRRPNQRMVEDGNHPTKLIKIQQSLIHGAKERWQSENCARFQAN